MTLDAAAFSLFTISVWTFIASMQSVQKNFGREDFLPKRRGSGDASSEDILPRPTDDDMAIMRITALHFFRNVALVKKCGLRIFF